MQQTIMRIQCLVVCVLMFHAVIPARAALAFLAPVAPTSGSCGSRFCLCGDDSGRGVNIFEWGNCDVALSSSSVQMSKLYVTSLIQARYAYTVVTSTVSNEAYTSKTFNYTFVIPDTAMVSRFALQSNGQVYVSQPKEKKNVIINTPSQTFADIRDVQIGNVGFEPARPKQPAEKVYCLSDVRDASSFVVRLRGYPRVATENVEFLHVDTPLTIDPVSTVVFSLSYEELLVRKLSKYTVKVHLQPGQVVPDLQVHIEINEGTNVGLLEVNPFTNDIYTAKETTAAVTTLSGGQAKVVFRPTVTEQIQLAETFQNNPSEGINGYVAVSYDVLHYSTGGNILMSGNYFIHFFSPTVATPVAKHALFVLDVSGSMQGTKIQQLKDALVSILSYLDPKDSFTVMEFSTSYKIWNLDGTSGTVCQTYTATSSRIQTALNYARSMTANGGTSINKSLLKALDCARAIKSQSDLDPILVLLTDGQPTDATPDQIIANVQAANAINGTRVRTNIYSIAFGRDANFNFLHRLSYGNGGEAHIVYEGADATTQLEDFYKTISTPLLMNVAIKYAGRNVVSSALTQTSYRQYFRGSELVVAGRLTPGSGQLTGLVTATGAGQTSVFYPVMSVTNSGWNPKDIYGYPVLERAWAFLTLSQRLEAQILPDTSGTTPRPGATSPSQTYTTALALHYSFVIPTTCLEMNIITPSTVSPTQSTSPNPLTSRSPLRSTTPRRPSMSTPIHVTTPKTSGATCVTPRTTHFWSVVCLMFLHWVTGHA